MTLYSNPDIPLISNPINLDREIQTIQERLGTISWIQKSFGRAWTGRTTNADGKVIVYPEVYHGTNEYLNVLPNDNLTGQCFIKVQGDQETITEYNSYYQDKISTIIDVIVCFRLDQINTSVTHRYTEELKKEVKTVLKSCSSIKRLIKVYEDPTDVFRGYTIDHTEWQTFKHPRGGFRFECELVFTEDC